LCYLSGRNLFHHQKCTTKTSDLRIRRRSHDQANPQTVRPRGKHFWLAVRPPAENNMEVAHARPAAKCSASFPRAIFPRAQTSSCARWGRRLTLNVGSPKRCSTPKTARALRSQTKTRWPVGQYIKRGYLTCSDRTFGKTRTIATSDGFILTDADFSAYNPASFFTQTEMIDNRARCDRVFMSGSSSRPGPRPGIRVDLVKTHRTAARVDHFVCVKKLAGL